MKPHILASGNNVLLRDALPSDEEKYVQWHRSGEWRSYDAPWELVEEDEEHIREKFMKRFVAKHLIPRACAIISTQDNIPLGWVNRYSKKSPDAWFVGIDICEDTYLNKGIGTESLTLWVEYLFSHADIHRIGLDTWSFNKRMARVAEKVGFTFEGAQREMRHWQGEWFDLLHFGMLRIEWENRGT